MEAYSNMLKAYRGRTKLVFLITRHMALKV